MYLNVFYRIAYIEEDAVIWEKKWSTATSFDLCNRLISGEYLEMKMYEILAELPHIRNLILKNDVFSRMRAEVPGGTKWTWYHHPKLLNPGK